MPASGVPSKVGVAGGSDVGAVEALGAGVTVEGGAGRGSEGPSTGTWGAVAIGGGASVTLEVAVAVDVGAEAVGRSEGWLGAGACVSVFTCVGGDVGPVLDGSGALCFVGALTSMVTFVSTRPLDCGVVSGKVIVIATG